ncbi:protein LURP-one-related 15-like [Cucurbita pepo subsp. pepo]|uniref:protein LURP-one-related 15-like n=1 Tax=Cucurbita pepo subsp. pepo TaxID=3664 RepID=UPI000C9D54B1|nr:protein LURP-one-related 15-like [Cucurbita pepo subsp. pepo]
MANPTTSHLPAPTNYAPLAKPVAVVSPQFMAPYPVDLRVTKKVMTLAEGTFTVTDVNGTVMFMVKGSVFSLHDRRILLDAAGNPIISFQQKLFSAHRKWYAFRGDSTDSKDLLFTVKKSSVLQLRTQLDVILASNTSESSCDFKIKGSWLERSCTISLGDGSTIIAQMHRQHNLQSVLFDKDTFGVTVYPNVDYAFIVALVVILFEINEDRSGND